MKIDKAGTYTFIYTAVDECGNETTETRQVVVNETYRTVLYEDGTFIINEKGSDKVKNADKHGAVVNEYPALDAEHDYVFANGNERYWLHESNKIKHLEFGSAVAPTSLAHWLQDTKLESIDSDWENFDGSNVTTVRGFVSATKITSLSLPYMPNLTSIQYLCNKCYDLANVDFSNVQATGIINTQDAFQGCYALTEVNLKGLAGTVDKCERMFANVTNDGRGDMNIATIYVQGGTETLDFEQATASANMFRSCTSLVGSLGTTFDSSKTDKEYARVDAPRVGMPGYFSIAS